MIPTTESAKRISTMFGRRITTPWAEKEVRKYRELIKAGYLSNEDLDVIERYYAFQRRKGDSGIHRRDLCTFLNNAAGELDRATAWKEGQHRKERTKIDHCRKKERPVSDQEFQRISDLARKELERFKNQYQIL